MIQAINNSKIQSIPQQNGKTIPNIEKNPLQRKIQKTANSYLKRGDVKNIDQKRSFFQKKTQWLPGIFLMTSFLSATAFFFLKSNQQSSLGFTLQAQNDTRSALLSQNLSVNLIQSPKNEIKRFENSFNLFNDRIDTFSNTSVPITPVEFIFSTKNFKENLKITENEVSELHLNNFENRLQKRVGFPLQNDFTEEIISQFILGLKNNKMVVEIRLIIVALIFINSCLISRLRFSKNNTEAELKKNQELLKEIQEVLKGVEEEISRWPPKIVQNLPIERTKEFNKAENQEQIKKCRELVNKKFQKLIKEIGELPEKLSEEQIVKIVKKFQGLMTKIEKLKKTIFFACLLRSEIFIKNAPLLSRKTEKSK